MGSSAMLSPVCLLAISVRFPSRTKKPRRFCVGGLHCKHFSLLSDAALERLNAMLSIMESLGCLPPQISAVTLAPPRCRLAATNRFGRSVIGSGFGTAVGGASP
eukprot:8625720-Pyramimonas_sp.AAC.1